MKNIKVLLSYYKSPVFLLKGKKIIEYNKEFKEICPEIDKNKDIHVLFNINHFKADNKQSFKVENIVYNNKNFALNYSTFSNEIADYLVTVTDLSTKEEKDTKTIFNSDLQLGYIIFDINKNNEIEQVFFPEVIAKQMGITDHFNFFKEHVSDETISRFNEQIETLFREKSYYFNFKIKVKYTEKKVFNLHLRCFPYDKNEKKQLFCSLLEYSDISELENDLIQTELSFNKLYEDTIDPILIIDENKIISINKAAKEITKSYGIDLLSNINLNFLKNNNITKDFLYNSSNYNKRFTSNYPTPKGELIHFEYTIIPISIKNKNLFAFLFKDITKQINLLDKIKSNEKRNDEILNSVSDGIILTDNLIIEFWNKSAEKITGYSKEEMIGQSINIMFQNRGKNEKFNEFKKFKNFSLGNQKILKIEKKIATKNKEEKMLNISISTFVNSKGEQKAVGIFRDITEKHLIQEEIKKKKDELTEINSALKSFFSILAHDMRTPVIQMMSLTELLLDNEFSKEEQNKYLSMLQISSKNGLELLDTIVEWGRAMTNKITINPINFNIDEIIEKTIRLNSSQASSKGITFEFIEHSHKVYADSNMVFTILNNIISNAIKFSYKNNKIIIKTVEENFNIKISVQDFGIGIKDTENIFLYDKKNIALGTENEKGKGIGLMFTSELIKKNNGKIWVESKLGKGSTFYFTLPKEKNNL